MELYQHQNKALVETEQFNRVAYYLDMGLGKTFVGSEKMWQLNNRVNLVICQKSKIDDWVQHFQEHYSEDYTVLNLTDKKQFAKYQEMVADESAADVVGVINYDLVYRRSYFAHMSNFTMMLDESSIIQNEKAKRSKFILAMNPENVILLSGTPTAGKYENLWSQLHLLGWGISKELYWKQYVEQEWIEDNDSGFKMAVITGYKNVDRLQQKLAAHGAIFMKSEEAFDLPEQQNIFLAVPSTKEYRKFMKRRVITVTKREGVEWHDDSDFQGKDTTPRVQLIGDTTLTKRLYARQLCGQYNKEKINAFHDLLQSTNDRLIVFYNFNDELEKLQNVAAVYTEHISVVNGSIKDLSAYEEFDDSVTFVQYQAGAMGLNLQKANKIVYFTLTDKSELFEQSKKRIHRIGQGKKCFYYFLMCRGSVEYDILETLNMRKDYTDALFEKHYS
ncbi:MAG: DEAD/DEAH box helicase [Lachnospiraceae bacterium]|nr:DEAD/DEAH box helicase [Lachnospiraceae bacterium]